MNPTDPFPFRSRKLCKGKGSPFVEAVRKANPKMDRAMRASEVRQGRNPASERKKNQQVKMANTQKMGGRGQAPTAPGTIGTKTILG